MKRPRSITWRLTALLQVLSIAVVIVFASSALLLARKSFEREERSFLRNTAEGIAAGIDREYAEEGDLARAAAAAVEEGGVPGVRVEIFGPGGERLAASPGGGPVNAKAEAGSSARRAAARARCGAVAVASVSGRFESFTLRALGWALLAAAIPLLIAAMIAGRGLIRRALAPLAEIGRRARESSVEGGVRSVGPRFGLGELDELVDSFDRLLGRLDDLLRSERRFSRDASHELQTPLTVIAGELELLRARPDLPPEARAGLERASAQVREMSDLIDALLLLRRTESKGGGEPEPFEPVNLADVAREEASDLLRRHPARDRDLVLTAPDEVLVSGRPALIASAVRNLLDNAFKFTSRGQRIQVAVERTAKASLVVEDEGRGIPPAERSSVFDPFYRGAEARAETRGFGLGLPILRQVARAHGGEVFVEDSPLGGARFVLLLPLWGGSANRGSGWRAETPAAGEV